MMKPNVVITPKPGQLLLQQQQHTSTSKSSVLLEDAELQLETLSRTEVDLVKQTEGLFKKQVEYMRMIDELHSVALDMTKIKQTTDDLSSIVASSYSLVEDVCTKVQRIDLAKARIEDCLSKISDILDLRTCRNGMVEAMKVNNYEEAAMHIKRFLSIDQEELRRTITLIYGNNGKLARNFTSTKTSLDSNRKDLTSVQDDEDEIDTSFHDVAFAELEEARGKLVKHCEKSFVSAIKDNNVKEIERYFKIFPLINEHSFGLSRYAEYLQSLIVTPQLDEIFKSKTTNQADKLAALFESIAKLIDSHQPLIETYYGPGQLVTVVKVLQLESGRLSRKILEEFRNENKLAFVVKTVKRSSMPSVQQVSTSASQNQGVNVASAKIDPRGIDNILNELAQIISRSEVYLGFIVQRLKEDVYSKEENESSRQLSLMGLYNLVHVECELDDLVQQVSDIYVLLEEFYLNESSKKAITMDQIDVESSSFIVSSMLDDIFFIIKKCTKRAISTKNHQIFCAIINNCVTLLESTFCQVLDERLKGHQYYAASSKNLDLTQAYNAIQSGRYLQSAGEWETSKAQYFSALNNLDKASDYILTLREILEADLKKLKPPSLIMDRQQDNQSEKLRSCLNELSQLKSKFMSMINSSLYQLFNTSLRNPIKSELKTILSDNPELTRSNSGETTSLAKNLLLLLDKSMQESLTGENYSRLVSIITDFLISYLKGLS